MACRTVRRRTYVRTADRIVGGEANLRANALGHELIDFANSVVFALQLITPA